MTNQDVALATEKARLLELVRDFDVRPGDDVRPKVLELIPIHETLRRLGVLLFPDSSDEAARTRVLVYLRRYPLAVISGDELMVVAGIQEWARRVRELRVEEGWRIFTGVTIAQIRADDPDVASELPNMKPGDYMLVDEHQDRELAHRWHQANSIRKHRSSVQKKILEFLLLNVGKQITGEELRYLARDTSEWARRVRELRTEHGWQIVTKSTGAPELPVGVYVLASDRQAPEHDRQIKDVDRRAVLMRDAHTCTLCGWSHKLWNPSDPRHLEVHHVEHHAKGGSNERDNLTTVCNVCHDGIHAG